MAVNFDTVHALDGVDRVLVILELDKAVSASLDRDLCSRTVCKTETKGLRGTLHEGAIEDAVRTPSTTTFHFAVASKLLFEILGLRPGLSEQVENNELPLPQMRPRPTNNNVKLTQTYFTGTLPMYRRVRLDIGMNQQPALLCRRQSEARKREREKRKGPEG